MRCPKCNGFVSVSRLDGVECVNCGWCGPTRDPLPEDDPFYGFPTRVDRSGRIRYPQLPDYLPGGKWDYEPDVNA